jgi:MFS family permease
MTTKQPTSGELQRRLPPAFARIWPAATVSALGDGIYLSALPLLAAGLTRNPMTLGVLQACALLPWLLFGLIGGALVDRWDRRRTMWIADLCRAALIAGTSLLVSRGEAGIALLCATAFLLGVGEIFFDTAATAYLPEACARDPLTIRRANARLQASQQAGTGFVGPPVGSFLFTLGRAVPLFGDALSFLFSSLTIRSLPPAAAQPLAPRGSLLKDAKAGAAYLFGNPLLVGLSLRPAVGNFAFMAGNAVLVLFVRDTLHLGTTAYGVYLTADAVGALVGTALAGRLAARLGTGGTLTLTAVIETGGLLTVGLAPNAWVAGAGECIVGLGIGTTMVLGPSLRQSIVPDELMGRVTAAARMIGLSAGPLGAVFGGWLAHVAGLRAPFIVGAGILAGMTLVAARLTSNRRIEAALAASRDTAGDTAGDTPRGAQTDDGPHGAGADAAVHPATVGGP